MSDGSMIVKERQLTIRRQLDERGLSLKAISFDSNVPYPTLLSYFPGKKHAVPAQIPTGAVFALCGHIPADLLSLLLPDGFQIVEAPEEIDHDALCELAADYVHTKAAAHRVDSEAGVEIGPGEHSTLVSKVTALRA